MTVADTIAAIATPPGKGGVAIVRVSGPAAWSVFRKLTGREPCPGRVSHGAFSWEGRILDEGLVLAFQAPRSYTGEDVVEFQCHGGRLAPQRVLGACYAAGARPAGRGEFTRRAFLNGKLTYEQAQGVLDLIDAKTERAADAALISLSGGGAQRLHALYSRILDRAAQVEYALDMDEGELPPDFWSRLQADCAQCAADCVQEGVRHREKRILREGALVVLAGPPNAGKSSLMNALLGTERAIVSAIPGTTRDTLEEGLDVDGWPIRLVDTAGLRETKDAVEAEGVRRTQGLVQKADILLNLDPHPKGACAPHEIRVHAKCDLGKGEGLNVSSKTGEGLDALRHALAAKLVARLSANEEGAPEENERTCAALLGAQGALDEACRQSVAHDAVLVGNALRQACSCLGELTGAVYSSDMLDRLFSRFCVGK